MLNIRLKDDSKDNNLNDIQKQIMKKIDVK